ncbi:hypothetical protein IG631_20540 [Alternaria alternata]|nr:hypothetical protein IG631_20540 [Alternaria alternata]
MTAAVNRMGYPRSDYFEAAGCAARRGGKPAQQGVTCSGMPRCGVLGARSLVVAAYGVELRARLRATLG